MVLTQWVLDTRPLWPSATTTALLDSLVSPLHHLPHRYELTLFQAHDALSLLPVAQRTEVSRYLHASDAKMALASRLLKRYAVSRLADVPWDEVVLTRGPDTKPVYRAADGSQPVAFNVSHQHGIVVLVAARQQQEGVGLGVDIVSPFERRVRDHAMIRKDGWPAFVEMHADVLCPREVKALLELPGADVKNEEGMDVLLRHFYALWCLREAYVKMTGEALLASWLPELEMRGFNPPGPGGVCHNDNGGSFEVWFRGAKVDDVDVRLVDFLDGYMVCTAVRRLRDGSSIPIGDYEAVGLQQVLAFANESRA